MKKLKKLIVLPLIVGLASQISIGVVNSDFRISAGVILFVTFIMYYDDLNLAHFGALSGITVYIFRILSYYISHGQIKNILFSYQLEILFYIFYSAIFIFLVKKDKKENINKLLPIMVISDFSANFLEIIARYIFVGFPSPLDLWYTLIVASVIRTLIAWMILNVVKYHGMLIVKEEHENRYKKLLWLTSQLKSEIYWIEKNMDNIENVMSQSYKLFEKISSNEDTNSWSEAALNIARDVHEIKKENGLIVRGIKSITEKELADEGIDLKSILNILHEAMKREIKANNKDIHLYFNTEYNFYTSKHYYLMSILRNLVMNSIDAIEEKQENAKIGIVHYLTEKDHHFKIWDSGPGIKKEDIDYIFSPGFSTKINYNTGEINRGLGLSIVKNIVEGKFKGEVNIKSTMGKGTSFHIRVPIETLEEEENENIYS